MDHGAWRDNWLFPIADAISTAPHLEAELTSIFDETNRRTADPGKVQERGEDEYLKSAKVQFGPLSRPSIRGGQQKTIGFTRIFRCLANGWDGPAANSNSPRWPRTPALSRAASPGAKKPTTTVVNGVDLWAATAGWAQPDVIEFLYGEQLARGFVTLPGAGGGTGKSAMMMATAVGCSLGWSLLGEEVLCQLRVLYLNLEDSRMKHRRSLKGCVIHYQLNEKDLDGWLYLAGADDIGAALPGGLRLIITDPNTRQGAINEKAFRWYH